jgi:hypothetical protein
MSSDSPPRVQFVVSGRFIILLLMALAMLGGGYYWYRQQEQIQKQQQQTQERFQPPPYFVNRGPTVIRTCRQCLKLGKLTPQSDWKIGLPKEVPADQPLWFMAIEEMPAPVRVFGVLMMPVHPAVVTDNPSLGFNETQVVLVLYQNLQRMGQIQTPPAPAPPAPPPVPDVPTPVVQTEQPPSSTPPSPVVQSDDRQAVQPRPTLNIIRTGRASWRVEVPADNEWHNTGISVIALQRLTIKPAVNKTFEAGEGHWILGLGAFQLDVLAEPGAAARTMDYRLTEDLPFVSGPEWLASLRLRIAQHTAPSFTLDVETEFTDLAEHLHFRPDKRIRIWEEHHQIHRLARQRLEEQLNVKSY